MPAKIAAATDAGPLLDFSLVNGGGGASRSFFEDSLLENLATFASVASDGAGSLVLPPSRAARTAFVSRSCWRFGKSLIAILRVLFGTNRSVCSLSFVSGDVLCSSSHFAIADRSYVKPSPATTGSCIGVHMMGQRYLAGGQGERDQRDIGVRYRGGRGRP